MTDYENNDEDNNSTISITEFIPEYKFLKTSTEIEIESIKKILSSLPPKNFKRLSRKNLTEQEKKMRALESNRIYVSRKKNLARLRELTEENDNYETILQDENLKQINELLNKKKELNNSINTELHEEKKTLENDLLYINEDNEKLNENIEKLKTIINDYKKTLLQQLDINKTLKHENDLLIKKTTQDNKPLFNNYNYTIPSAIFKTQPNNYLATN